MFKNKTIALRVTRDLLSVSVIRVHLITYELIINLIGSSFNDLERQYYFCNVSTSFSTNLKNVYLKEPSVKILIFLLTTFSISMAFAGHEFNTDKHGVILDGYDVVSYFQVPTPKKGNSKIQAKVDNVVYWFSSEENKNIFLKEPKKYEPAFGGWCAYAVADSKSKVEVDPKSFVIQDGRLLVFYDGLFGNTRKKWTTTKDKSSSLFLKEADQNWPALKSQEP